MNKNKDPITTPIDYMLSLNWNKDILDEATKFLIEWDKRDYKGFSKINKTSDQNERENYRNCVNFWREKLNNETKLS